MTWVLVGIGMWIVACAWALALLAVAGRADELGRARRAVPLEITARDDGVRIIL